MIGWPVSWWALNAFDGRKEVVHFREHTKWNDTFRSLHRPYRDTEFTEQPEITTEEQAWKHGKSHRPGENLLRAACWPMYLPAEMLTEGLPWAYETIQNRFSPVEIEAELDE